ncbi:MAG TPA: rhodanese-like domain-containing protein [Nocardioidaceae bacterium]|jgi:rhodanese-related sulfurtransferase
MRYAGDLSPAEAWALLQEDPAALLVDVRTEAEWTFVGVPDLSALGKKVLAVSWVGWPGGQRNESFLEELRAAGGDQASALVFLCRSGHRSAAAAEAATEAGLAPSYNVAQGFEGDLDEHGRRGHAGWRASGLPWRQS